jgi:tetratricopeptide (TPR) repeat protein
MRSRTTTIVLCSVSVLILGVAAPSVMAQGIGDGGIALTPAQELELEFADRLMNLRMPDYAERVLKEINPPLPASILDVRKIEQLSAQAKFEEATQIIAKRPDKDSSDTWSLKLTLADGYFAYSRYEEARGIYESFFKAYPSPPAAIRPFYLRSAYKYGQMMLMTGNRPTALKAYDWALAAVDPQAEKHVQRQLMGEKAEMLMKLAEESENDKEREAHLANVEEMISKLMWSKDLWFGKSVVMLAHIRKMRGDIDGAMSLIDKYKKDLKGIDDVLQAQQEETGEDMTKLSPMAQCRYLIAALMQEEADKLLAAGDADGAFRLYAGGASTDPKTGKARSQTGALQHFYNVFVRYPNTQWAPDAGDRANAIKKILEEKYGKTIQVNITDEMWAKVEEAQSREAKVLFNQSQWEPASEAYVTFLNTFPNRPSAVRSLADLATCFIELENETMADMVVRHLAERYGMDEALMTEAGNAVLRLAFAYSERGMKDKERELYDVFLTNFPKHARTPGELFRFGMDEFGDENYEGALVYFLNLVENYKSNPIWPDAANQVSVCYTHLEKHAESIKMLNGLVQYLKAQERPGHRLIGAQFRLATALSSLAREKESDQLLEVAIKNYKSIEELLGNAGTRSRYENSSEEVQANDKALQGCLFYRAMLDITRKRVPAKIKKAYEAKYKRSIPDELLLKSIYKKQGADLLVELADRFPKSEFSPSSLSQAAAVYSLLEKSEEAAEALKRLKKDYPDTEEAKNAEYMMAMALLDMGNRKEAMKAFREMFAGGGDYKSSQLLMAGRQLLEAREYEIAIDAFTQAEAKDADGTYKVSAQVGRGRCEVELGSFEKGIKTLEGVREADPRNPYTIEICRSLAHAYSETAKDVDDPEERKLAFNKAVDAINTAGRFAQDKGRKTELKVEAARIAVRKARAEQDRGNNERYNDYLGKSVGAYLSVIMFTSPFDEGCRAPVEDAYVEVLPLMVELERFDDAMTEGTRYLNTFKNPRYALEVKQAMTMARVGGGKSEEGGEETTTKEEPTGEPEADEEVAAPVEEE